jgi:hypothetical protein
VEFVVKELVVDELLEANKVVVPLVTVSLVVVPVITESRVEVPALVNVFPNEALVAENAEVDALVITNRLASVAPVEALKAVVEATPVTFNAPIVAPVLAEKPVVLAFAPYICVLE